MNIYLISQSTNNDYDTYDSAVVIAPDEETAKTIHPSNWSNKIDYIPMGRRQYDWVDDPELVKVELIGVTSTPVEDIRIVCSSYNAG